MASNKNYLFIPENDFKLNGSNLVGNPHIVEMIRFVVVNKAYHTFQKASLSEKLGLQLHRLSNIILTRPQMPQYSWIAQCMGHLC